MVALGELWIVHGRAAVGDAVDAAIASPPGTNPTTVQAARTATRQIRVALQNRPSIASPIENSVLLHTLQLRTSIVIKRHLPAQSR
jgi:hypothetical protein